MIVGMLLNFGFIFILFVLERVVRFVDGKVRNMNRSISW